MSEKNSSPNKQNVSEKQPKMQLDSRQMHFSIIENKILFSNNR